MQIYFPSIFFTNNNIDVNQIDNIVRIIAQIFKSLNRNFSHKIFDRMNVCFLIVVLTPL